jgi:hypothetical protein
MIGYESAKKDLNNLPHFYIGQEVNTELGKGIIVKLIIPNNCYYISPERSKCSVWFGSDNSKFGWNLKEFTLSDLEKYKETA